MTKFKDMIFEKNVGSNITIKEDMEQKTGNKKLERQIEIIIEQCERLKCVKSNVLNLLQDKNKEKTFFKKIKDFFK